MPDKRKRVKYSDEGANGFDCDICVAGFTTSSKLVNHKRTHEVNSLACQICKIECKNDKAMADHFRNHNKKAWCSLCYTFLRD